MRPDSRRYRPLDKALFAVLVVGAALNFWAVNSAQGRQYRKPPAIVLPAEIDGWKGQPQDTSQNYDWILPHARVEASAYSRSDAPYVAFTLIASQDPNDMHTPDRCIKGSGFEVGSDELRSVRVGDKAWEMHLLHITKPDADELVLYGYDGVNMMGGSTLLARIFMKLVALKDPAYFVRFSTSVLGDQPAAEQRLEKFAESALRVRDQWELPKSSPAKVASR